MKQRTQLFLPLLLVVLLGAPALLVAARTGKVSSLPPASLPNGVAAGDVTQTSAVLWARSAATGSLTFTYAIVPNLNGGTSLVAAVTEPLRPVTVTLTGLKPGTAYTYRVTNVTGASAQGRFRTPAAPGSRAGLRFGVSGDWQGALSPYPAISNAAGRNLDFFVEHGDTIYADVASPAVPQNPAVSLVEFRLKHGEAYATRFGLNTWADLRAATAVLATIDDHEVRNDFAGGADVDTDSRFPEENGFINDTQLYENGLLAFQEYNPLAAEFYGVTGDPVTAGERRLYRYRTFGRDAAIFLLDGRSFRDQPLAPVNLNNPLDYFNRFRPDSFDPDRMMLGAQQLADLQADLLEAQQQGIVWKFLLLPQPIQLLGPVKAQDRYEGYAAERTALLEFIDSNRIANVVFITADLHGTLVNNLAYQAGPGQPLKQLAAFEVVTGPVAVYPPFGPSTVQLLANSGLISAGDKAFYDSLPVANDLDDNVDDKDDFVKQQLNGQLSLVGYDPIGLDGSPITAKLVQGDYLAGHTFGWTEFEVNPNTRTLLVTTYGILSYTQADLEANPGSITGRKPVVVSQFMVNPNWVHLPTILR